MNVFYTTVASIAVVDKYMIILIIESIKAINRLLSIYIINSTNLSPTILLNWKSYQDINDVNNTLDDYSNYYKNKYLKEIEKFKLTLQVSHLHNKNSNNYHHHNNHHNSQHHDDHHRRISRSYKGKRSGIMLVIQKPTINSIHNTQLSSKITNSHVDGDQSIDTSHTIQPTIIQDITQQNLRTTPEGLKLAFIYRENRCLDDNSEVFYNNDSMKTPERSKNSTPTTPQSTTVASSLTAKMARVITTPTTTPIADAAVMSSATTTTTTTITSIAVAATTTEITTPVRRRPLQSSPYDSTLHSTPSTDRTRHTERQQRLLMSSSSSSSASPVVMMNSGGGSSSRSRYSSPILPYNVDRLQGNCSDSNFAKTTSKVPSSPSVMNGHDVSSCNSCHHHSTATNDRSESVDKEPINDDNQDNNSISGSNVAVDDDDGLNQEASHHSNLYRMMSTTNFSVQSISPVDAMKLGEVTLFLFCITMLVTSTQCSNHYDVIIPCFTIIITSTRTISPI
jgi:hypothetical protein